MSSTTAFLTAEPNAFERTIADLKQGVDTAVAAQAEASKKAIKTAKDLAAFNQGTLKAVAEASQILMSGSQDLFRQMAESGQSAFAETLAGARALVTAPTAKERFELQTSIVRTAALWSVSEASRFARAGIELSEKVSAPLTARAVLAAESFSATKA